MRGPHCSIPPIRAFSEIWPLHAHHAEALAAGRLHHCPAIEALEDRRAEFFQARDFGFDVIGFYVEVHAACVVHALQLDHRLVRRCGELPVPVAAARVVHVDGTTECRGPEAGRGIDVVDVAVDLQRAKTRVVHQCAISFSRFARNSLSLYHFGHSSLPASSRPTSYSAWVSSATPEKSHFGSKLSYGVW